MALAAAFLSAIVYGYAGNFWPVTDVDAGIFIRTFYQSLFMCENDDLAFLDARNYVIAELDEVGDLTGHGLFYTAMPPQATDAIWSWRFK